MEKTNELWSCITGRIDQIKAMPNDVIININDNRDYGRINKADIEYDNDKVWVRLNRNTTLTLFVKSDYSAIVKKAHLGSTQLAQSEIAHTFDFSKALDLESVFEDWQETI